jgi:hypothetical protein
MREKQRTSIPVSLPIPSLRDEIQGALERLQRLEKEAIALRNVLREEYVEKLLEREVAPARLASFLADLDTWAIESSSPPKISPTHSC